MMLHVFDETGVAMISGSDTPDQSDIAGVALQRDLDLLQDNGLAPLIILRLTTFNPAVFLGRQGMMGTVEMGRNAVPVLLEGDTTKSTQNLHRIGGLVRAGPLLFKGRPPAADGVAARATKVGP